MANQIGTDTEDYVFGDTRKLSGLDNVKQNGNDAEDQTDQQD
jgi:hypothetical protein